MTRPYPSCLSSESSSLTIMNETQIIEIADINACHGAGRPSYETPLAGLEQGNVLYFPTSNFCLAATEHALLDVKLADPKRKNICLQAQGTLLGVQGDSETQAAVRALLTRYQAYAKTLAARLFPAYTRLRMGSASLRLHRVEKRLVSWRKDDSRLHVDAFPARPNYGERILRVFVNINPTGEPRVWRIGEPFEAVARHFLPRLKPYRSLVAWGLAALRLTKTRRSAYDHLMLQLHDTMKSDLTYQGECPQQTIPFPAGSAWICFSDQTPHAAMSGQFMLEQTFFLPVDAMVQPQYSPLHTLTRLTGRALI